MKQNRLLALDGLRGVSVGLVVASHLLSLLVGLDGIPGGLGVTIFFFISGFIITRILLDEVSETGGISLRAFYTRRFFRLMPALLGYVFLSWAMLKVYGVDLSGHAVLAALFYYANYFSLYSGIPAVNTDAIFSPLSVLWSLAIEEHFYFVFPALVLVLRRRPVQLALVLGLFVLVALAWRSWLVLGVGLDSLPDGRIYLATDTRLDSIVYGCLLSVWIRLAEAGDGVWQRRVDRLARPSVVAAGLALLLLTLLVRQPAFRETARYSLQGLALVPLFAALFAKNLPMPHARAVLEHRFLLYVGQISYSFYMYHFLAIAVVMLALPGGSAIVKLALALVLGLSLAAFSYYVIETPLRRFGARLALKWS